MSSMEEVTAAEERVNAAKNALLKYLERGKMIDQERYRGLAAKVKRAEGELLRAIAEMGE